MRINRSIRPVRRSLLAPFLCVFLGAAGARGDKLPRRDPPLLFGGAPRAPKQPTPIDPALPTGPELGANGIRPSGTAALCSSRAPVCVHRPEAVAEPAARSALDALEASYERVVGVLRLPAPANDGVLGGSSAFDMYLDPTLVQALTLRDEPRLGGLDSASAFCRAPVVGGALLARAATLCLGEAAAFALDPGESAAVRRAYATELWWLSGVVTSADVEAVDELAAHPERALFGRELPAADGSALFFDFLERARSVDRLGALPATVLSLGANHTEPVDHAWKNEPDLFDVLRHSLDEDSLAMADLLADFATARAFLGDRDDGLHAPFTGWAGAFARPSYDWLLSYSSLPRRVKSRPIDPTGAELVWLDLDQKPMPDSVLGFQAEWEAPVAFEWRLIAIDAQGRELQRVELPFQEQARSSEGRMVNLEGARAVIAVGVNIGGVDASHPHDPDHDPFEPHACTLYFAKL